MRIGTLHKMIAMRCDEVGSAFTTEFVC
jgi:hypothetical protein